MSLGKCDDVANTVGACHEHNDAVQTERDATVWRASILKRAQQETELLFSLFLADFQKVEYRRLHGPIVNTNRAAADFGAVDHQVIGTRQGGAGIRYESVGIVNRWRRERMMQRIPSLGLSVFFEHWEVDDPKRRPALGNEIAVRTDLDTQGAQCVVDDTCLIRAKEDQVARFRARAF